MSSIIYNGHEIQDLIVNGNHAQLWLNGQKLYPTGEPAPVDTGYYFDFGNTYTLNSGTPGSVDLSNTDLKYATKRYVCIAMDVTITAPSGFSNNILSISGFDDVAQVDVYNKLEISSFFTSGDLVYTSNSTITTTRIAYSNEIKKLLKVCFIFNGIRPMMVDVGTRTAIATSWKEDLSVYNGDFLAKYFTTISTPGNGSGAIEATKFVGRGFDKIIDAMNWFNALT